MKLNCLITNNDAQMTDVIEKYIEQTPSLQLIGRYTNAAESLKATKENHIDLIFLNTDLTDLSGLEFATMLDKAIKVIFTTNTKDYAVESYKVSALDYLVAPISYEDFLSSIQKALDFFHGSTNIGSITSDRFFLVKSEYKMIRVDLDDITYIEGLKDYVKIHFKGKREPIVSLINMRRLDDLFPRPEFMRVHRSYIAHMTTIDNFAKAHLTYGTAHVPISDTYRATVVKYAENHMLV